MKIDLSGRTALVTGSTAGIGLAIAKSLAASGAQLIVNGRSAQTVEAAVPAVQAAAPGARVTGFAADLGTAAGCDALVAAHPSVDVLVNNMGVFGEKDFFDADDDVWHDYFDYNVLSGVRLARAYMPAMMQRHWGRVVFISSESAFNIPVSMIHYGVTKTAVVALARGLAKRAAGTGVTVNSVLPGPTLSDGMAAMMQPEAEKAGKTVEQVAAEFVRAHRASSLIQRTASVQEVASMVTYVCSPQASATTGAALRVDGGVVDTL